MKGDGNWCRADALALHGKPVTFLGAYAAVTVVRNKDDSFTAGITRPSGETDFRCYARRGEELVVATVPAKCASIAAHGPESPMCWSGEHSLCGHVAFPTPLLGTGPAAVRAARVTRQIINLASEAGLNPYLDPSGVRRDSYRIHGRFRGPPRLRPGTEVTRIEWRYLD